VTDEAGVLPVGAPRGAVGARINPNTGFLHVRDSKIARSGILVYSDGKKQWNEFRSDATIAASAPTFSGVVFTNQHPPVLVTVDNVRDFQAGHVGAVRVEGKFLVADEIVITQQAAIDRAQQPGGWELSIGFLTDVVRRDGTAPDGKAFQFEQTELEGNHVAGEDVGRAGPEVRLAMDSSAYTVAALADQDASPSPSPAEAEEQNMSKKKKNQIEKALAADAEDVPTEEESPSEEEEEEAETDAEEEDEGPLVLMDARVVVPKKAAAAAAKGDKKTVTDTATLVSRRVSLMRAADSVLDSVADDASDRTIQLAVIAKCDGDSAIEGHKAWSDERLQGRFDGAIAGFKSRAARPTVDTAAQIAAMTGRSMHGDASGKTEKLDLADLHTSMVTKLRDGWREPAAHTKGRVG